MKKKCFFLPAALFLLGCDKNTPEIEIVTVTGGADVAFEAYIEGAQLHVITNRLNLGMEDTKFIDPQDIHVSAKNLSGRWVNLTMIDQKPFVLESGSLGLRGSILYDLQSIPLTAQTVDIRIRYKGNCDEINVNKQRATETKPVMRGQ